MRQDVVEHKLNFCPRGLGNVLLSLYLLYWPSNALSRIGEEDLRCKF